MRGWKLSLAAALLLCACNSSPSRTNQTSGAQSDPGSNAQGNSQSDSSKVR